MSLRIKFLVAAVLAVLVPLMAYLLLDAVTMRSILLEQQAQGLRQSANLIHVSLDLCQRECKLGTLRLLESFGRTHPDLEILILDAKSEVFAASRPELAGRAWHEAGIEAVLAGRTDFHWDEMEHQGVPVLDTTIPWRAPDGRILGVIHLARNLSAVDEQITRVRLRHLVFVVAVAILVGVILSLVTYRLVIRPLSRLDQEFRVGRPALFAPAAGGDEVSRLSDALRALVNDLTATASDLELAVNEKGDLLERVEGFNEELEHEVDKTRKQLLRTQRKLVRAEHLSTIGQLSAGLAHEVRNPLFIIRATAEKLGKKIPDATELSSDIIEEVDRVETLVASLLELGRPLELNEQAVNLSALLDEVCTQVARAQPEEKDIIWEVECAQDFSAIGDMALLRQAFTNILSNGCEAIAQHGRIEVRIVSHSNGELQVSIKDDGRGVEQADLARVFEPFFTRKPGGTGLGLAASKKILGLHGAEVEFDSRPGAGTEVSIRFQAPAEEDHG